MLSKPAADPHGGAAHHGGDSGGGCCSDDSECCELLNVLSSLGALALSGLAAGMATAHAGDVRDCLLGLGPGAGPLEDLMVTLSINYGLIVTLNLLSTLVLWLSFFHCDSLECSLKHTLTSSKALGWLLCLTWVTFGLQLFRLGYALTLHGVLASLAYICNLGPGVVYLAQELVYAMGNATQTNAGSSAIYSPYGDRPYGSHSASSPYIDVGSMVMHFNFLEYCKDTDDGRDSGASSVMYGCFLTLLSQALMAMALSGEKARVSVHDLHETHSITGMASQFGSQAHHAFEHMPLLTTEMTQALHNPSGFASSLFHTSMPSAAGAAGHPAAAAGPAAGGRPAAAFSAAGVHPAATSAALSHPAAVAAAAQAQKLPMTHQDLAKAVMSHPDVAKAASMGMAAASSLSQAASAGQTAATAAAQSASQAAAAASSMPQSAAGLSHIMPNGTGKPGLAVGGAAPPPSGPVVHT